MLEHAVDHFKNEGKTVFVLGHSYGAFVIQNYLANYESKADNYGIVSGRINPSKEAQESFLKGINGNFENGTTFVSQNGRDFSQFPKSDLTYYQSRQLLKAAIAEVSFLESLIDVDMSNMIYVYNPADEQVGGMNNEEINFLKIKGVQLYETEHPHSRSIYGFVDAIESGAVSLK